MLCFFLSPVWEGRKVSIKVVGDFLFFFGKNGIIYANCLIDCD